MSIVRHAAAGLLAAAALATPAWADSVVYVKDNNVWLANPDGSGAYQVTLDGTQGAPYETPSEADDGTILAVRETPGARRQLYRMRQNGGLLNPPVNTPAPGTGAIDAKISPDGQLVAYWFVTTVRDPLCTFCVDTSERVLLSHADRFTGAEEIGTPNTGGWPSWLSNDTITLGSGSATQWYYKLGMPEAAEWFTDSDVTGDIKSLLDAEAAPTGDRLAVVEGDNQESLLVLRMNGAPPAKPTVANGACAGLTGPSGKFVDPTWSADGRLLAWQEDDGVWTMTIPGDLADCAGFGAPALRIAAAKNPDLSPAAINPGPRPGCGNPGNPAACPSPSPGPGPGPSPPGPSPAPPCRCVGPPHTDADTRAALTALVTGGARSLGRTHLAVLLRRGLLRVTFTAPAAGTLTVRLSSARGVLATGRRTFTAAGTARVDLKITKNGRRLLRRARKVKASLRATFAPVGGTPVGVSAGVGLRR